MKFEKLVDLHFFFVIRQDFFNLLQFIDAGRFHFRPFLKTFNQNLKPLAFVEDFSGPRQRLGFHATQIPEETVETFDGHVKISLVDFVCILFVTDEKIRTVEFVVERLASYQVLW